MTSYKVHLWNFSTCKIKTTLHDTDNGCQIFLSIFKWRILLLERKKIKLLKVKILMQGCHQTTTYLFWNKSALCLKKKHWCQTNYSKCNRQKYQFCWISCYIRIKIYIRFNYLCYYFNIVVIFDMRTKIMYNRINLIPSTAENPQLCKIF